MGGPPSSAQWRKRSLRNYRNAKIKWINRNGHRVARSVRQRLLAEIRGALVGCTLRKIAKVRRIVCAKNPAEFASHRKQIVVITQIGQELFGWRIRGDIRENRVLNSCKAFMRLHEMRDPPAACELLIEKTGYAIVGHCQRDVRRIPNRRVG